MCPTESDSPASYQVHIRRNVMVPTGDGVSLATDIHQPARGSEPLPGPFPTLLHRTPYNKLATARDEEARFFAQRGYAVAVQDCRGRYESGGGFTKYTDEGQDGYDTLVWLGRQSWCNGRVGTFGLSYGAHTQAALASLNPPHLACMWLDSGGFANAYLSGCRNGGAFELRQLTWAFREALESPEVSGDPQVKQQALAAQDIHGWFQRLPWKKGHSPLRWTPDYENYLLEIWGHDKFDDYWRQVGLCAEAYYAQLADVPQVHMGSWYDPYARSTTENFAALSASKQGPVWLIMGPWTHGGRAFSYSGDVDFGQQATLDGNLDLDYNHLRLRFFDRWLKGEENGWDRRPLVQVFVMGGGSGRRNAQGRLDHGGRWQSEQAWPTARSHDTPFYLHAGGGLSLQATQGNESPSRYRFDPHQPTPTIGGNISSGLPIMEPGGFNQQEDPRFYGCRPPYLPLASRPDVLVFQTEPLDQDLDVTGPIVAHLWVASSAPDTDFTAKLVDVYPPSPDYPEGYDLNLTDGVLRAKFCNSWEQPELLEPGRVYLITIQLYPTSNLFAQGHRIRLDISSSNFPRLDVNGNTGENPALSPIKVPADNSIYHDAQHPSHAVLPVVES